jgi:DNA (cytosine-5)-methyltransferase 1
LGLKGIFPTLREIAHVEIEAYAIANLVEKMEESKLPPAPIFTNLKTFPFSEFRGCVDIISGGFPCQPFSTAGKRKASEDPRHLFPFIKDGIAACRPRLVFLENVEGIISAKMPDGTSVLQYVLSELESVGYRATAGVFSAAEVGASHQRKRVFILAMEDSSSGGERDEASRGNREAALRSEDGQECTIRTESTSAMADTERDGRGERCEEAHTEPSRRNHSNGVPPIARPGEEQFAHEEPRTKSKLGRTTNGSSNRVDRLRACGNGVVPATAEKAFKTLINKLI